MFLYSTDERKIFQTLRWGTLSQERLSPADTMYATTGWRIYAIGDIDGRFRPRSNPYDLYAFGKPQPDDPLANKLQGVWAQPVKGINSYGYTIEVNGEPWVLADAERFTQAFASVQFDYQRGSLRAIRQDFAAQDLPVLFSALSIKNEGNKPVDLRVAFTVEFDLQDAWFTQMAAKRNASQKVTVEVGCLVARAQVLPDCWAAVVGGARPADETRLLEDSTGEMVYHVQLAPGTEEKLVFGMAVESQGGAAAALSLLDSALPHHASLLEEKQKLYAQVQVRGTHFTSPDALMNAAFDLAQANLQALEVESPGLGRYFYAGLEMFPFWFSNDGAYSASGMVAAGLGESARNHMRIGLHHLDAGRVPHQISPSGKVAFAGNAQETPLWVMSIWDVFRWTGDRAFLAEMYPGALRGMFDYVLGRIDADGDGYPSGPGMVEVEGMGAEKLDSAAYTWAALRALAAMADLLGDADNARLARARAGQIAAKFDADWWDEPSGTYAMSLTDPGNARYPVPHWAVIVPLEVGLAAPEHAARTFATLRAQYINRWGLKHTAGEDERVWTLPTATLSRAAFRYGECGLGFEMLRHVAETLETGSIGMFHELIPEGACFLQLWSGATFLRGVIEDLLGLQVNAGEHRLCVEPHLPPGWDSAALEGLTFGEHRIAVKVEPGGVEITHQAGQAALWVEYVPDTGTKEQFTLAAGESRTVKPG